MPSHCYNTRSQAKNVIALAAVKKPVPDKKAVAVKKPVVIRQYNTRFQAKKAAEKQAEDLAKDALKKAEDLAKALHTDRLKYLQAQVFSTHGNDRLDAMTVVFTYYQTCPNYWKKSEGLYRVLEAKVYELLTVMIPTELQRIWQGMPSNLSEDKLLALQDAVEKVEELL